MFYKKQKKNDIELFPYVFAFYDDDDHWIKFQLDSMNIPNVDDCFFGDTFLVYVQLTLIQYHDLLKTATQSEKSPR